MRSTRPAFCAVREAIVCHECVRGIVVTENRGAGGVLSSKSRPCERCGDTGYNTETTEAALDRLYRDGLYPWRVDDPVAPRWWCDRCEGIGLVCTTDGENEFDTPCGRCGPSFADIEAVVSLGHRSLSTAVAIAGEIAAKAGFRSARIAWNPMPSRSAMAWRHYAIAPGDDDDGGELIKALPIGIHLHEAKNDRIVLSIETIESITLDQRHGEFRVPPNVADIVVYNRFARASSALMAMVVNAEQPSVATAEAGHGFVHYALFGGNFTNGATIRFRVLDEPNVGTKAL
jgi:hypothetical protein